MDEIALQDDGNLVLYTRDGQVAWASNTDSPSKDAYTLEVSKQDLLIRAWLDCCELWAVPLMPCGSEMLVRSFQVWAEAIRNPALLELLTRGQCTGMVQVTDSGALVWYCETSGEEVWTSR